MKATYKKHILNFKQASGTSRGVLRIKETYFLKIETGVKFGVGECALFRGLSADDTPDYEEKLKWVCENIELGKEKLYSNLIAYPSIQFGLEQAFLSLQSSDPYLLFPSEFTRGKASISINGLIWMGDTSFMKKQIEEKLKSGFATLKLKIGALDFESELAVLKAIRSEYSESEIEIRVDANGAFLAEKALEKLNALSAFKIHSIEQPIKTNQWVKMADLCLKSPIPIALDEELIGVFFSNRKEKITRLNSTSIYYFKAEFNWWF